ncbi:MAG: PDZ domain-containing protein [Anaerolineales bacterium]|jgi:signal transduction histidine kinase
MAMTVDHQKKHPLIISLLTDVKVQIFFAISSLCIIIVFVASFYIFAPNDGIRLHAGYGGRVFNVMEGRPADEAGIFPGDLILTIDGRPVDRWLQAPIYRLGTGAGDIVVYGIQRGDQILTISVEMGSYLDNLDDFVVVMGMQFLSVLFWVIGVFLCLFAHPRDVRSRLVGLIWLLGGIAVAAGGSGILSRFWGASTIMEISWSLLAPVLVSAHLYFPDTSFSTHRRRNIIWLTTVVALFLAGVDIVENWVLIPRGISLSQWGIPTYELIYGLFLLSVLASASLLLRNYLQTKNPDIKRQVGIVFWGTVLGLGPFLILSVLPILLLNTEFVDGSAIVLSLVLVPFAYTYVIHQRRLLRIDFMINRAVALFIFVLLVLIVSILISGLLALVLGLPRELSLLGGLVAAIVALPFAAIQTKIQEGVNRVLYGSHYDFSTVSSSLSYQLAQTLDRTRLIKLMTQSLSTQMGIQQSALFLIEGEELTLQLSEGETLSVSPNDKLCQFLLDAKAPVQGQRLWSLTSDDSNKAWNQYLWGELFVPMVFENQLCGVLILGSRTRGDLYSDRDIQIIANVAHQGALAFANVRLVETLRGLTQRLVRADEEQRKKVARELHDSVLQDLFFIKQRLLRDPDQIEMADHLDEVIQNLYRTIKSQRTALLDQGLPLALQDLIADMQKLAGEMPTILWQNNTKGELRLMDEQATSVYRIAQESLYNALKHSKAEYINVKLEHAPNGLIRLLIEDDGIGFSTSEQARMSGPPYGLLGMQERALMIGAKLHITTRSGEGTAIILEFEP